ncbi:unnamed protein product [Pylaiella littoralis]
MSPFVHCAATAILVCPYSAAAFVSLPSQQQQRRIPLPQRLHHSSSGGVLTAATTPTAATTTTTMSSSSRCSTGPSAAGRGDGLQATELAATAGQGVAGEVVNGEGGSGSGEVGVAKLTPPRSVLERPWDVEVDFHGERRVITVQPGDSILEAAEMSGMNLSYECRRGNCISCAAKVQDGSSGHFENRADRGEEDGAPGGFVLTCSTHPTGPGVKLDLSANADMWEAYCARFDDISTQDLFRQTSAGLMRKYRVEHPDYFREEVERQFNEPQQDED